MTVAGDDFHDAQATNSSAFPLRWSDGFISIVLLFMVLIVFEPTRHYGYVRYDDDTYIFDNPLAQNGLSPASAKWAVTHLVLGNYMPIPTLTLLADVSVWGLKPGPMHVENVMIHGLTTIGWYAVWVTLTGRRGRSFMVAAVFGSHPMHVEPVAWITERGDLLCTLLLVGSMLAYVYFVRSGSKLFYALSVALLPLAVLSKTIAMVFPGILLLVNVWPLARLSLGERRRFSPRVSNGATRDRPVSVGQLARELTPFLLIAAGAAAMGYASRTAASATFSLSRWPIEFRLANAAFGYGTYLLKLFWPEPMIVAYPLRTAYSGAMAVSAAGLLGLLSVIAFKNFRRRPYLLIGWLWFLGTLLPTIGFVPTGMYSLADRYTYVPYVGLSVAIVWWAGDIWKVATARFVRTRRPIAIGVCGLVLLACGIESRRQLQNWSSSYALWTHAYTVAPENVDVLKSVGTEYRLSGQLDLATEMYAESVKVSPRDYDAETKLAGMLLKLDPQQALPHYQRAALLGPKEPYCWWDLGLCRQQLNQFSEAEGNYRKALELDPQYSPARQSLESLPAARERYREEMPAAPK